MNKKISLVIGILSLFVAIFSWRYPVNTKNDMEYLVQPFNSFKEANLVISGVNTTVNLLKGTIEYDGGTVSSIDSIVDIYIPNGQLVKVNISGVNISLNVDSQLKHFVFIKDSGLKTQVNN